VWGRESPSGEEWVAQVAPPSPDGIALPGALPSGESTWYCEDFNEVEPWGPRMIRFAPLLRDYGKWRTGAVPRRGACRGSEMTVS
jgi:hypothetical protein